MQFDIATFVKKPLFIVSIILLVPAYFTRGWITALLSLIFMLLFLLFLDFEEKSKLRHVICLIIIVLTVLLYYFVKQIALAWGSTTQSMYLFFNFVLSPAGGILTSLAIFSIIVLILDLFKYGKNKILFLILGIICTFIAFISLALTLYVTPFGCGGHGCDLFGLIIIFSIPAVLIAAVLAIISFRKMKTL